MSALPEIAAPVAAAPLVEPMPGAAPAPIVQPAPAAPVAGPVPEIVVTPKATLGISPWLVGGIVIVAIAGIAFLAYKKSRPAPVTPAPVPNPT